MLMVFQGITQLTESLIPYLTKLYSEQSNAVETAPPVNEELLKELKQRLQCPILDADDGRVKQSQKESKLQDYEGIHEDYLELFIQFGFVLLFMVTYPLASLGALLNNIFELPFDAFKLARIYRRPAVSRAGHIGAWQPAFRIMCSIGVMTNCACLYIMGRERSGEYEWGTSTLALICVSLDHILLAVQTLLGIIVPAFPSWVRVAMAKEHRMLMKS